jgi:hypothetical protein
MPPEIYRKIYKQKALDSERMGLAARLAVAPSAHPPAELSPLSV